MRETVLCYNLNLLWVAKLTMDVCSVGKAIQTASCP